MAFGKSPSGPAPLLGLRASRALWVSDSVMWGVEMRTSVRGWKVEGDPLSVRSKPCNACLRKCEISWSGVTGKPSGWIRRWILAQSC